MTEPFKMKRMDVHPDYERYVSDEAQAEGLRFMMFEAEDGCTTFFAHKGAHWGPKFNPLMGLAALCNIMAVEEDDPRVRMRVRKDGSAYIEVDCSHTFQKPVFGIGSEVEATFNDVEDLYLHWRRDTKHGIDVWCAKRMGLLPCEKLCKAIEGAGVWDLKSLNLRPSLE